MERNSTNENFEHFLRQNAEEFKMYPSDKVWDGISKNLNKRKRRFYLGLATLLITSSALGYTLLDFSFSKHKTVHSATPSVIETVVSAKNSNSTSYINANNDQKSPFQKVSNSGLNSRILAIKDPAVIKENEEKSLIAREDWIAGLLTVNTTKFLNDLSTTSHLLDFDNIANKTPLAEDLDAILKPRHKNSKFGVMFYFAPTVSYRKLSENKSYLRTASATGAPYGFTALYDINNAVTHKPDIGLEFGAATKYSLTKNIKLRAGLQFNINRYDIKAFKYTPEVATIALNARYRVDSVNAWSSYRNFSGGKSDWLQNFYFQVSAPVGIEVNLHNNEKMRIGVASTIQPTYVLGDRAYLITADYKNYAQVPWLTRRWNVNTNLETFVGYSTGKLNWQVGPQVRYQLLSSFVSKYPVKENLFDFGLKVGISVNQNH